MTTSAATAKISTVKISSQGLFLNGYSKRSNSAAWALVNEFGEFGFLKGETNPYTPIGGRKALMDVYSQNCIEFRPYVYGKGFSISKPTTL